MVILPFDVCRIRSLGLYASECTTEIRWYVTVLFMERLNVGKLIPLIVAAVYIATGDYASFMHYIKAIF